MGTRVEIVRQLGREVWLADHAMYGRVVYKRASPHEVWVTILAGVVRVHEHADDLLVMEPLPGERLDAQIRRRGHLPVRDAVAIARELARSLAALHARGIIHGDIKPENVVGRALIDFGSARMRGSARVSGTPAYTAPEPVLDVASDIYSLGCVLFAMLAGRPPCGSRLSNAVAGASRELDRLVARCLANAPAARFASADELARALDEIADHDVCPRLVPRLPIASTTLSASALALDAHPERATSPALVAFAFAAASALAILTGLRIAERAGTPAVMPAAQPVAACRR
jgi:eukaryotic-like serine/threonine-protein kinase